MLENRINAVLSAADKDEVLQAIETIRQKLPFLIDLSPEDRRNLPKMGDKSRAFVAQALEIATQDDSFLPRSFAVTEMRSDVELSNQLYSVLVSLGKLTELVEDTYTQVGSEAYTAALVVYQMAKNNGQGEALDNLLDAMAQRFARKSVQSEKVTGSA